MSPYSDSLELSYSSYEVCLLIIGLKSTGPTFPLQVNVPPSTVFLPHTPDIMPHLVSNGSSFFEVPALCPSPGPPMTPFNMDMPSPSQQSAPSSLHDPSQSQGYREMASDSSTFSLALPNTDFAPSSPSTISTDELPEPQTEDELRARLDRWIRSTRWFRNHESEPTIGAKGVPRWAAQLALDGRSVYECFVKTARAKGSIIYKCSSHGCKFTSTRLRRVVGHQRKKRNHKPFACKAHPKWYVLVAATRTNTID